VLHLVLQVYDLSLTRL
jgi:hypothetical protein